MEKELGSHGEYITWREASSLPLYQMARGNKCVHKRNLNLDNTVRYKVQLVAGGGMGCVMVLTSRNPSCLLSTPILLPPVCGTNIFLYS